MDKTKILIWIFLIDFVAVLIWAFLGDVTLTQGITKIMAERWSLATVADLLFGLSLISILVYYNEKRFRNRLLWILSFFLLGNIGPAIYLLVNSTNLKKKLLSN